MKVLDYNDLYELIKCCAHDLDSENRKSRDPILDKLFLNFGDYCIRFYHKKYDFTSLIEVLIYLYVEPDIDDIDDIDVNEFLNEYDFYLRFKNVDKNKTPHECVEINDNFISYIHKKFDFFFTEDYQYNPRDLCNAFLTVVGESDAWRSLVKEQEEMAKNEHQ